MSRQLLLLIYLTLSLIVPASIGLAKNRGRPADLVRQGQTITNMQLVQGLIDLYREDHHSDPPNLGRLAKEYSVAQNAIVDGWGRALFYYTTGNSYVLASFGKGGAPRPQLSRPGSVAPPIAEGAFEVNIVMINGEWAQTPSNVDR